MESEDSFDDISDVSLNSKTADNKIINIKELKKERVYLNLFTMKF